MIYKYHTCLLNILGQGNWKADLEFLQENTVGFLASIMMSRDQVMNDTRNPPDRSRELHYKKKSYIIHVCTPLISLHTRS